MKTPNLIDVPKDSPTLKERIEAFKKEHSIWTQYAKHMRREEFPWTAMLMPTPARTIPYTRGSTDPFEIIAHAGMWMEEAGLICHGTSERDALRRVCEENGIQCPL